VRPRLGAATSAVTRRRKSPAPGEPT